MVKQYQFYSPASSIPQEPGWGQAAGFSLHSHRATSFKCFEAVWKLFGGSSNGAHIIERQCLRKWEPERLGALDALSIVRKVSGSWCNLSCKYFYLLTNVSMLASFLSFDEIFIYFDS